MSLPLRIGARTIVSLPRTLRRVSLSLDGALSAVSPPLPPLDPREHGWFVTSLAADAPLDGAGIAYERQRYTRWYVDLAAGREPWHAALSGQMRSTIKRRTKKLAEANGGTLDVRAYRTPAELAACHPLARAVSATTYQERLLGSGLPADPAALAGEARAWLLFLNGAPIAYLWCGADGDTLRYDFVGHDPARGDLSPGTVLMAAALDALFNDRFARFDFTEGEGRHKRGFATAGIACRDVMLLRPTLANRAALATVAGWDAAMAVAKRASAHPALAGAARRLRRA